MVGVVEARQRKAPLRGAFVPHTRKQLDVSALAGRVLAAAL